MYFWSQMAFVIYRLDTIIPYLLDNVKRVEFLSTTQNSKCAMNHKLKTENLFIIDTINP